MDTLAQCQRAGSSPTFNLAIRRLNVVPIQSDHFHKRAPAPEPPRQRFRVGYAKCSKVDISMLAAMDEGLIRARSMAMLFTFSSVRPSLRRPGKSHSRIL